MLLILNTIPWITFALIALCGLLFYLFNELEDKSVNNRWKKHTGFFNKEESWANKWKLDQYCQPLPVVKKWYYFGVHPRYRERFFLSSTILVFLTDGEHLFQFFKLRSIEAGIFILDWRMGIAWIIGIRVMSFVKERFLSWLN